MMSFKFNNHLVKFVNIKHDTYEDKFGYGINFYHESEIYNLHCNSVADNWCRIIINSDKGWWKDLPFHEGTWGMLPDNVKIEKIK